MLFKYVMILVVPSAPVLSPIFYHVSNDLVFFFSWNTFFSNDLKEDGVPRLMLSYL